MQANARFVEKRRELVAFSRDIHTKRMGEVETDFVAGRGRSITEID